MNDWKCASVNGWPERIYVGVGDWSRNHIIGAGSMDSYNCVKIGLHEFFVEVHFIEVAIRLEDDIHVIKTCNLWAGCERCIRMNILYYIRTFL